MSLVEITTSEGNGESPSSNEETPHIHSGRYWFEMGKNSDYQSDAADKTNIETQIDLSITPGLSTGLNLENSSDHPGIISNTETEVALEIASEKSSLQIAFAEKSELVCSNNNYEKPTFDSSSGETSPSSQNVYTALSESDEDVIEVKMSPLPTICIDSSDDDSLSTEVPVIIKAVVSTGVSTKKPSTSKSKKSRVSPVPSIMSSTSDDFLQNDCAELSTSGYRFNFNLHGSDLASSNLNNSLAKTKGTPRKKSKKEQLKSSESSRIPDSSDKKLNKDVCFVTPKNKKNKTKKTSFTIQSTLPVPCMDIYESESSDVPESLNDVPINSDHNVVTPNKSSAMNDEYITLDESGDETYTDLVVANVTGAPLFKTLDPSESTGNCDEILSDQSKDENDDKESEKTVSKVSDVDSERSILKKYYDDSWGGENFDHKRIAQSMPGDRRLWEISHKDLYAKPDKRRQPCKFCHQFGHRSDSCKRRPKLCFMCGELGHTDWNCPHKLCLQCGTKSNLFLNSCKHCYSWNNVYCNTCECTGHPTNNCPDIWRRYHLTTTNEIPLIEQRGFKPKSQQYCSCCTSRGHVVSECKNNVNLVFDFRPTSVYVKNYEPLYTPDGVRETIPNKISSNIDNNTYVNKRKSESESAPKSPKSPKRPKSTTQDQQSELLPSNNPLENEVIENQNLKEKGSNDQVLQDNNVSNTSDALLKQMILLTSENKKMLDTKNGQDFLQKLSAECTVTCEVNHSTVSDVLCVNGNTANQNKFQLKLKDWLLESKSDNQVRVSLFTSFIPKKCNKAVQMLTQELKFLNKISYMNPKTVFSRLNQEKAHHNNLRKQVDINEKMLSVVRKKINQDTKILNMILLGQAGLGGGKQFLEALVEKINHIKKKKLQTMSAKERTEIGRLYGPIFSSIPRGDYYDLLKEYEKNRQVTTVSDVLSKNNKETVSTKSNSKKKNSYVNPPHTNNRYELLAQVTHLKNVLNQRPYNCNVNFKVKKDVIAQLEHYERIISVAPLSTAEHNVIQQIINFGNQMIW